jgi:hypothetical protein
MKCRWSAFSLVILIFPLAAAPTSQASTIHVPKDQPTIQDGINAAKNGDKVLVAPGTYTENINFMGKAITVTSSGGPKVTIIDGSAVAPVAAFVTGEGPDSVLSRFTLQNGYGSFTYQYQGGGVSINSASPTITKNVITSSYAGYGGGVGIYFGSPIVSDNIISNNSGGFGGGMSVLGVSNAQLLNNTINGNSAGYGGAIAFDGATNVFVEDNKILNNSAAGGQGGGFWIVNESDEIIIQNLFANNIAPSGSQIYSSIPQSQKGFALINNTIVSVPNGNADAAVIADGFNTNVLIENNIIYAVGDNAALLCNPIYQGGPPIVEFNDAFNPSTSYGDSCLGFSGSNGNISANPKLVNVTKGNYQLKATSPAINAGSNSAPDLPTKDLAGHPRIVGGTIDMGAYEFQEK